MKRFPLLLPFAAACLLLIGGCDSDPISVGTPPPQSDGQADSRSTGPANIVEVTTSHEHHHHGGMEEEHHHFELSTDELSSGWTTFRFDNSEEHVTHFGYIAKLPVVDGEQITYEDYQEEVTELLQEAVDNLESGMKPPEALAPLGEAPDWFRNGVEFMGGPGLTSPGEISETTMYLEEGTYLIECYVKTADGKVHTYLGMIEGFEVTGESSGASQPRADLSVTLSEEEGLEFKKKVVRPGTHTFEVFFKNQANHGGFGHDVHLVRLEGTDVIEVAKWVNWMYGLRSSEGDSGPGTFLGGSHDIFTSELLMDEETATAYFTADLTPGRYALISEVPDPLNPAPINPGTGIPEPMEADLVETFTVPTLRDVRN